jgi:2-hydroxy-3-oxopropionate reductase
VARQAEVIVPDAARHARRAEGAVRRAAWPALLAKGKTVVDMSSISPIETKAFAKQVKPLGADYLDAPVSGGEVGAKAASLTIMVGGRDEAAFARVQPLFALMGKNITHVGPATATARPPRWPTRSSWR